MWSRQAAWLFGLDHGVIRIVAAVASFLPSRGANAGVLSPCNTSLANTNTNSNTHNVFSGLRCKLLDPPLLVKSFHQRTGSCSDNFPQSACRNNLRTVLHRTDLFTPEPPIKTSELSQFTRHTVLQRCILTVAGQQEEVCRVTKHWHFLPF